MKQIVSILLALLLATSICLTAGAADTAQPFEDTNNHVKFQAPIGWSEFKEGETNNNVFAFINDSTQQEFITYYQFDIYTLIPEDKRANYSREEVSNSNITTKELEDAVFKDAADNGIENVQSSSKSIGNYDYFVFTFKQTYENGTQVNAKVYAHIYNGYFYGFRYETLGEQSHIGDLDTLVKTVNFTDETTSNKVKSENKSSFIIPGAIGGAIAAGLGTLIVALINKKKNKKAAQAAANQPVPPIMPQQGNPTAPYGQAQQPFNTPTQPVQQNTPQYPGAQVPPAQQQQSQNTSQNN